VSTIHFNRKELADEFVLKAQEEMRVNYSVIVVPGEEYHQVGKYTRLPEKFAQQHHRRTAPAYQPPAGKYAAAVRGEGGGAVAVVESSLEVVRADQVAQSRKMQGMENTLREVESHIAAQVTNLMSAQLQEAVDNRFQAALPGINAVMQTEVQASQDRILQRQRQETEGMLAAQAAGLQEDLRSMAAHAAAQATSLEEKMAAQTSQAAAQEQQMAALVQSNQQIMAFMQSQAARQGEGGLGLAKGDG
jgi:hypothetical protein